jgi:hypothetical protein
MRLPHGLGQAANWDAPMISADVILSEVRRTESKDLRFSATMATKDAPSHPNEQMTLVGDPGFGAALGKPQILRLAPLAQDDTCCFGRA